MVHQFFTASNNTLLELHCASLHSHDDELSAVEHFAFCVKELFLPNKLWYTNQIYLLYDSTDGWNFERLKQSL